MLAMNIHSPHLAVLVVEDDFLVRLDAAETLRDAGFEVLEADDAAGALELMANRDDIGLLFTDINMPGAMDGVELARRAHLLHPAIRLLLTSGEVRPTPKEMPDDGVFIAKPYSPGDITHTVTHLLASGRPTRAGRRFPDKTGTKGRRRN